MNNKRRLSAVARRASRAGILGGCSAPSAGVDGNLLGLPRVRYGSADHNNYMQFQPGLFCGGGGERFPGVRLVQDRYAGQYRISEHTARVDARRFRRYPHGESGTYPQGRPVRPADEPVHAGVSRPLQRERAPGGRIWTYQPDPGPLSFNCNIYNQTLFEENGWTIPENYEELFGSEPGDRSDRDPGLSEQLFDSASQSYQIYQYCVFSALDTLTQVDGQNWHNKLMAGENVPLDPMETAFRDMRRMMEIGAVRAEDMDVPFNENLEAMARREVAIGSGGSTISGS